MNLVEDLSKLTTISTVNINRLVQLSQMIITHSVLEAVNDDKEICNVDIGIGTLSFLISENELKYKFTPSEIFEKQLVKSIKHGESPICIDASNKLKEKITRTYKDFI